MQNPFYAGCHVLTKWPTIAWLVCYKHSVKYSWDRFQNVSNFKPIRSIMIEFNKVGALVLHFMFLLRSIFGSCWPWRCWSNLSPSRSLGSIYRSLAANASHLRAHLRAHQGHMALKRFEKGKWIWKRNVSFHFAPCVKIANGKFNSMILTIFYEGRLHFSVNCTYRL